MNKREIEPKNRKRRWEILLLLSLGIVFTGCAHQPKIQKNEEPVDKVEAKKERKWVFPETKQIVSEETYHGKTIHDPYLWLEDEKSKDVASWTDTQAQFTRDYLDHLEGRDELRKRLDEILKIDGVSAPKRRGNRVFYSRRKSDAEKTIYYWKDLKDNEEKLLLDPNALSEDGTISVGVVEPSWDGRWVAYTLKENNADNSVLYVMDVDTGKTLEKDRIPGARYARPKWLPNNDGFYYVGLPDQAGEKDLASLLPGKAEVRYHKIGTDKSKDRLIKEASGDAKVFTGIDLSYDGKTLILYKQHGWNSSDIYYQRIKHPDKPIDSNGTWMTLVENRPYSYGMTVWKDVAYVLTNEGASRYRLFSYPMKDGISFDVGKWKTVIDEPKEGKVMENVSIAGDRLLVKYLDNVVGRIETRDLEGNDVKEVKTEGLGSIGRISSHPVYDTFYYAYETLLVPPTIYESSVKNLETKVYFQYDIPVDPTLYDVEQVFYSSKDGTKIPMFIITKKGAKRDGSHPMILTGYGGFEVSLTPYFRGTIYPWLEHGGSYAIVNLRGGGEFGAKWHDAGKGKNKQNVFDDFENAAKFLIQEKYTSPKKLAIYGGSNGGLLVGAAMTQHPELYGAVICAVPLLDMIRYTKYGAGITWVAEYGDPTDKDSFEVLYNYSPYHHIKDGTNYPPLLMLSSDHDDRVDPMHARKFVAKLQAANHADVPVLLRLERNAGHGGADQISKYVETVVDMYSFLLDLFSKDS